MADTVEEIVAIATERGLVADDGTISLDDEALDAFIDILMEDEEE
jgi:stage V sporulation protein SpoVS